MFKYFLFSIVINVVVSFPRMAYKNVVIIHGINDTPDRLKFFSRVIEKYHPGTNVTVIDEFNGKFSLLPMWVQVQRIGEKIDAMCKENPRGIHLIGYSQGGLIARGIVQTLNNHSIINFVSLVAPQNGQYGETDQRNRIPAYNKVKEELYKFFYTKFGQLLSVAGYWKDPHRTERYLKHCEFLPVLNNRVYHNRVDDFKRNFLRLKKCVLIASSNDTTITPWQSSRFGFFDENEIVVEMQNQNAYKDDLFGLRTMDERGDLIIDTISGLDHQDLPDNEKFIVQHIIPWLT